MNRHVTASSGGMSHLASITNRSSDFLSKQNAIFAWSLKFHPRSRTKEYGAWLYRGDDAYFFRGTRAGGELYVQIGNPRPRSGESTVAWIHTHPHIPTHSNPAWMEFFSIVDGNVAAWTGFPGLLVTPEGNVRRIDPNFDSSSVYGVLIPHGFTQNGQVLETLFIEDIFNRRRF